MLAVLPFENLSGDPGEEYFSDGLTEEMITQLAGLNPAQLGVIARTSAMQYKRDPRAVDRIGQELGVHYVLEGSVRRQGNRVRVSAQLIQVSNQAHLWATSYDRELGGILALQSDVARAIADEIQIRLTPQQHNSLSSVGPIDPEAYEAYLEGRFYWNKRTGQVVPASDPRGGGDAMVGFLRASTGSALPVPVKYRWSVPPSPGRLANCRPVHPPPVLRQ